MEVLNGLRPERVFYYFEEICKIPHGSGNTQAISNFCVAFAQRKGLPVWQDGLGNVVIRKNAFAGYENRAGVILQGHLDMVCEKACDSTHCFETEGLSLKTEGDWVFAEGTTLGGDDGIAVAMALAILEDSSLRHPPLEVVLTVDEEVGMEGAKGLDFSQVQGSRLLNIDSEKEGVLTVGCAGGARADLTIPLKKRTLTNRPLIQVKISGLLGGHSGMEIHKGRLNAIHLMATFLKELPFDYQIAALSGGGKDNAIPTETVCALTGDGDWFAAASAFATSHQSDAEPNWKITVTPMTESFPCLCSEDSAMISQFLSRLPAGVLAMCQHPKGLVETSCNPGILRLNDDALCVTVSVRSALESKKQALLNHLQHLTEAYGGECRVRGVYPAWVFDPGATLYQTMVQVYRSVCGTEPAVEVIHAGLECGLLMAKRPQLEAVSFGPNIQCIHTPNERLSISSVERTYQYLCRVLQEL